MIQKIRKTITGTIMFGLLMAGTTSLAFAHQAQAQQTQQQSQIETQQRITEIIQELLQALVDQIKELQQQAQQTSTAGTYTLSFDTNLAELEKGHYEGWVIVGDDKISTGKFNVGDSTEFTISTDPDDVDLVAITIEPEGDTDDIPSGIIALVGEISDGEVDLSFPVNFEDASARAILATPSDSDDSNETSGVWFVQVPGPEAGLELPELPEGWIYEGWAVNQGVPLSTGKFSSNSGADDFGGFTADGNVPPYPGEDFLENEPSGVDFPLDLADGDSIIVISVEPNLDGTDPTGPGPAQAKPFVLHVEEDTQDHTNLDLEYNEDSLPSGTATIK